MSSVRSGVISVLRQPVLLLAAILVGHLGCIPFPEPLSDEQHSVVDGRLSGRWNIVLDEAEEANLREELVTFTPNVGNRSLAMLQQAIRKDGTVQHASTSTLITTQVRERWYISHRWEYPETRKVGWSLFQYRFPSSDEIHVFDMREDRVRGEVRAGRLPGRLKQETSGLLGETKNVTVLDEIAATPEKFRSYLKAHPDACFDTMKPIFVLKRK